MTAAPDPSAGDPDAGYRPADSGSFPLSSSYDPTVGYQGAGYPSSPVQYPATGGTGQFPPVPGHPAPYGAPAYDPAAYSPPPYGQSPYAAPGHGGPVPFRVAPRNGMGTAGLVLGIIGVVFCWSPLGIILGILAIIFGSVGRTRAKNGEATNRGSATAGLVLGIVAVTLLILFLVVGLGAYTTSVSTTG